MEGDGAVIALVQGLVTEQIGGHFLGGGAALPLPEEGARVVCPAERGAFSDVETLHCTLLVHDAPGQFEVRVRDIAVGIRTRDQSVLDVFGEPHAPDNWSRAFGSAAAG